MRHLGPMRRLGIGIPAAMLGIFLAVNPALACGGLIGPNGAVNLLQTTTFAGYHDGVEHYVTAFQFAGGGGAFGSITPLPGIPSSVEKGGDWTLQRLIRETSPLRLEAQAVAAPAASGAEELMKVKIDALDITVLRGGAADIGQWATKHGCRHPPRRSRGPRLLRPAQPDLPRSRLRCKRGAGAGPADRRRHAGPHHDPDRQPVGPTPHPRPRQDRRGGHPGRRLPPDRSRPGAPSRSDGRQRHPARPQRS
ncbi:MAG TPA: hypothetical protein VIM24_13295, partial [Candidatus Limnocylindrales bacterium]